MNNWIPGRIRDENAIVINLGHEMEVYNDYYIFSSYLGV